MVFHSIGFCNRLPKTYFSRFIWLNDEFMSSGKQCCCWFSWSFRFTGYFFFVFVFWFILAFIVNFFLFGLYKLGVQRLCNLAKGKNASSRVGERQREKNLKKKKSFSLCLFAQTIQIYVTVTKSFSSDFPEYLQPMRLKRIKSSSSLLRRKARIEVMHACTKEIFCIVHGIIRRT